MGQHLLNQLAVACVRQVETAEGRSALVGELFDFHDVNIAGFDRESKCGLPNLTTFLLNVASVCWIAMCIPMVDRRHPHENGDKTEKKVGGFHCASSLRLRRLPFAL